MSPTLLNIYIKVITKIWENELATDFVIDNFTLNTLLYADDQIIFANSEDNLQRAVHLFQSSKRIQSRNFLNPLAYPAVWQTDFFSGSVPYL